MDNRIIPKESIVEKLKEKYPDLEIGFGEDSVEYPKNINKCISALRAINPDADFYPAIILKNGRFLYAIVRHSTNSDMGINIPNFVVGNMYDVCNNENSMHMIEDGSGENKTFTFFKLLDI
jgi:hypothetical protein